MSTQAESFYIEQTRQWILSFIIQLNLCPFARREMDRNTVRFQVSQAQTNTAALADLEHETNLLNISPNIATGFLIFPSYLADFMDYLDFVDLAEAQLHAQGYEGIYQLATFHPDYCFAGTDSQDPGNYTNRSPYPMLHLLREAQVEQAIAYYGNTEQIPENNLHNLRSLGLDEVKKIVLGCFHIKDNKKDQHGQ